MEWAFRGPSELARRLGSPLTAETVAAMDPERLKALFSEKPALHRYPGSMAARCQEVCQAIVDRYQGDAAQLWEQAANGAELFVRVKAIPGFGEMKAKIFIALLGKQLRIATPGWREVCVPYGEPGGWRSVADVVDATSLEKVREFKAAAKRKAASKQG
jgi:uncharacterized HhH-GPD family protein